MVIQCTDSIRNVILYGYSIQRQHQECYFVIQCMDSIRNVILYGSDLGTLLRSAIFRQSVTEYQSGICFDEICSMKFRHDLDSH